MRHIVFPALAFTALCLATACQYETLPDSPKNGLRMMTVHASHADTRTYVSQKGNKWVSAWDEYDKIDLFELSDDNCSNSVSSECGIDLDADGKATFTMLFVVCRRVSGVQCQGNQFQQFWRTMVTGLGQCP